MGSIFKTDYRPKTKRQLTYLSGKKTSRKVVKRELNIQIEACQWLREILPEVHFRSDTASGAFNSRYEKNIHNKQQSSDSLPDITIFAARRGYHGLLLELKDDAVNLKMKRDGTKIRVRKDARGRIVERDYKIRKKGDWSSLHIEKQANRMIELREAGYYTNFAVGLHDFKKFVAWYFDFKLPENESLF